MDTLPGRFPVTCAKKDPLRKMKAVEWRGTRSVKLVTRPRPLITEPTDVLVRVTTTSICGSDLHLYHNLMPGLNYGDILGHEAVGIVEEVGIGVRTLSIGDRVVISAFLADGTCSYCRKGLFACCDGTNPSKQMEKNYGYRSAAVLGSGHAIGGYDGVQAEYVRIPLADVNCLKVPGTLRDEQVIFLSDIACTAWSANDQAKVGRGQTVAVWGCGPVGLLTLAFAKFRGASRIIAVDTNTDRLNFASRKLGADVIEANKGNVFKQMKRICPDGPDVCIDCVGLASPKSVGQKLQSVMGLETDPPQVLSDIIKCVRKGGVVFVTGVYLGNVTAFPIGSVLMKNLTIVSGLAHIQRYWHELLSYIEQGKFDPTFIITHRYPLTDAERAYDMFDKKEDGVIKIILKPQVARSREQQQRDDLYPS